MTKLKVGGETRAWRRWAKLLAERLGVRVFGDLKSAAVRERLREDLDIAIDKLALEGTTRVRACVNCIGAECELCGGEGVYIEVRR